MPLLALFLACQPGGPPKDTAPAGSPSPTEPTVLADDPFRFEGEAPRNLLLISIDTWRRDSLRFGGGDGLMDWLDSLAAQGVVVSDLEQCSNWTFAAMTCTLQGSANELTPFLPPLTQDESVRVPESQTFLAEVLRDAGYQTALLSTNGWLGASRGNAQGYTDLIGMGNSTAADVLGSAAVLMGGLDPERPWFVHLHLYEPHAAYAPPTEYLTELSGLPPAPWDLTDRDEHYETTDGWNRLSPEEQTLLLDHLRIRYRGDLAWLDDQLEAGFARLDSEGHLDDTLVLFVGDHGEAFFEHGEQTHAHHLYAEEVDVPGIFWAKNLLPAQTEVPVSGYDLAPTLLRLVGLPAPEAWTGRPIQEVPLGAYRFASTLARQGLVLSVTSSTHRLQIYLRDGQGVLTDHSVDPAERRNLYDPNDATTQALWSRLRPHVWGAVQAVDGSSTPIVWPEGLPR